MITKLLLGSQNANKLREVRQIFQPLGIEIISMQAVGLADFDVIEDCDTFRGNALKKAREISRASQLAVLADDSGLQVDYLDGAPGVYSARYSGEHANYQQNNQKLLAALAGVPTAQRSARFVCVLAFVDLANSREHVVRGHVDGIISDQLLGEAGFGYDPLFYVPQIGMTFAQAEPSVKNAISHRAEALRLMRQYLEGIL